MNKNNLLIEYRQYQWIANQVKNQGVDYGFRREISRGKQEKLLVGIDTAKDNHCAVIGDETI